MHRQELDLSGVTVWLTLYSDGMTACAQVIGACYRRDLPAPALALVDWLADGGINVYSATREVLALARHNP